MVESVYNPEPSSGLGPTELPCSRTKATRKTIESGIPENCPVELPFWTRQSKIILDKTIQYGHNKWLRGFW